MRKKFKYSLIFLVLSPSIILLSLIFLPISGAAFLVFGPIFSAISIAFFIAAVGLLAMGLIEQFQENKLKANCVLAFENCEKSLQSLREKVERQKEDVDDQTKNAMNEIVKNFEKEHTKLKHKHEKEYAEHPLQERKNLLAEIPKLAHRVNICDVKEKAGQIVKERIKAIQEMQKLIEKTKLNESNPVIQSSQSSETAA